MPASDLFKRTLEAGSSLVGMTRERAEALVKEWVEAGDLGKAKAQKAVEELLERSRKLTGDVRSLVRREMNDQLVALGVATQDDIARLEARLRVGASAPGEGDDSPVPTPGDKSSPTKAAPINKAAATKPSRGASEA